MSLPATPDTTAVQDAYIKAARVKAISFTADDDYSQGDFLKVGSFFGVVAEDVADTATGSLIVDPFIEVQAEQSGVSFSVGDKVYYTSAGAFASSYAVGSVHVGNCTIASASDIFSFAAFGILTDTADIADKFEIVAAGEHTMATADEDIAITGVLATDIVIVSLLSADTTGAGILTGTAEADNVNITSTEVTTGDGVASYVVIRATA